MGNAATSVALCFDTRGGIKQEKHASHNDVTAQSLGVLAQAKARQLLP